MNKFEKLDQEHELRIREVATKYSKDGKLDFEAICHSPSSLLKNA